MEKLPVLGADGSTGVPGLYVVGDLTGIPLLKLAADTGARAVWTIVVQPSFVKRDRRADIRDLVIVGGGVSGLSAALEAKRIELDFLILEASEPFSTIVNFPKKKPIYTYPTAKIPAGDLQLTATQKEPLLEELRRQAAEAGIAPKVAHADRVRR